MEERLEKLNEYQFAKLSEICHKTKCEKRFFGHLCVMRRRELGFAHGEAGE
jgi:uncharacterized ferredoxin-like protein